MDNFGNYSEQEKYDITSHMQELQIKAAAEITEVNL